jgi:hypothetical protein
MDHYIGAAVCLLATLAAIAAQLVITLPILFAALRNG